jgi:hypothetical protein
VGLPSVFLDKKKEPTRIIMVATSLQQEQDLKAWASTLPKKDVDVLRAFMAFLVTTPAETLQLPEFSGLDHENPQNFLELCEKPTPRGGGTKSQHDSEVQQEP